MKKLFINLPNMMGTLQCLRQVGDHICETSTSHNQEGETIAPSYRLTV